MTDRMGAVHESLLPRCVCGGGGGTARLHEGIPVVECPECGVVRQVVHLTTAGLAQWYRDAYHTGHYTHTYDHDAQVAEARLQAYALPSGVRVLDVGCGNGAFVHAARQVGLDAWGQDYRPTDDPWLFSGSLHEVAFPTDDFDVVTMHDVLEHVVDVRAFLHEVARVCKPGGTLLLDFPHFHVPAGKHHWKPVEHLWMFREAEVVALLRTAGFDVTAITSPIPSKLVFRATRTLREQRPEILVPAGIGDAYWVLTKLPGFLRSIGVPAHVTPEVWVQDEGGPPRTVPFLRTVAAVHPAGYKNTRGGKGFRGVWHEAYFEDKRTVYQNVCGVPYFIAYNGALRQGRSLYERDPEFGVDWHPRMHVSKEMAAMRARMQAGGPYAALYFVSSGMYRHWLADFPSAAILQFARLLREAVGRVVFIGADWDKKSVGMEVARAEPESETWVNLIGQTSYDELGGVLRGASAVAGWPSGATLVPPAWDVPTVLVWNKYFKKPFWVHSVAPSAPYAAVDSAGLTPESLRDSVLAVSRRRK